MKCSTRQDDSTMGSRMRRGFIKACWLSATLLGLGMTAQAWAESAASFPSRPVTIVVPFTPGGPTDIVGRSLGAALSKKWGQSVIIENRPGAGGDIGSAMVARAKPDGYTLILGVTGSHAINKWLYKSLPYDPQKDFEPVSLAVIYSNVIVANPNFPANNLQELIALAKKDPNKYSYGSDGNGTASNLSMELLKEQGKFKLVHVPYKGSSPMLNDVMGGTVPLGITGLPAAQPMIKAGGSKSSASPRLRTIAVITTPLLPAKGFRDTTSPPSRLSLLPKTRLPPSLQRSPPT